MDKLTQRIIEILEKDFITFRRPISCVRDFVARDCEGNYHKLQEINPKDILAKSTKKK